MKIYESLMMEGHRHLVAKQYQAALWAFKEAAEAAPDRLEPHYLVGYTHLEMGETDAALREFESLIRSDPSDAEAHIGMAETYRARGDLLASKKVLESARAIPGNSAARQFALGRLAAAEGNYDQALDNYRYAAEWNPDDPRVAIAICSTLIRLNRNIEACSACSKATAYPFVAPAAYYNLGIAEHRLGNHQAAVRAYQAAVDSDSSFYLAYTALVGLEIRLGRWLSAWRHFRQTIKCSPIIAPNPQDNKHRAG